MLFGVVGEWLATTHRVTRIIIKQVYKRVASILVCVVYLFNNKCQCHILEVNVNLSLQLNLPIDVNSNLTRTSLNGGFIGQF